MNTCTRAYKPTRIRTHNPLTHMYTGLGAAGNGAGFGAAMYDEGLEEEGYDDTGLGYDEGLDEFADAGFAGEGEGCVCAHSVRFTPLFVLLLVCVEIPRQQVKHARLEKQMMSRWWHIACACCRA